MRLVIQYGKNFFSTFTQTPMDGLVPSFRVKAANLAVCALDENNVMVPNQDEY